MEKAFADGGQVGRLLKKRRKADRGFDTLNGTLK